MPKNKHILFWLIATLAIFQIKYAQAQSAKQSFTYNFEMGGDRSVVYTQHIETTPLNQSAIQNLSQYRVSVSAGEKLVIVEAFTRKANGKIVPVDKSQIAKQSGSVGSMVSESDVKIVQIPFPDLNAGDTWVLTLRFAEKEHYIPGHFSWLDYVSPDDTELSLDYRLTSPETVPVSEAHRDFAYKEGRSHGKVERHWWGTFLVPPTAEKSIANLSTHIPMMEFSTSESYESLGRAYFASASPKAAVTPEIKKLAAQITAGVSGSRPQAEAIFDWVSRNVQYVAVYFGSGRVVPNDAEVVLRRRFGDCKDHATLMSALLKAQEIESEQALIYSSALYELPKVPVVQAFDHVILYIPSLGLYADPTDPTSTLGRLSGGLMDKPVLRVSDKGATLARTPAGTIEEDAATIDVHITVNSDGRQRGETEIEGRGEDAQILRDFVNRTETEGENAELQKLARWSGISGRTSMDAPSSLDHSDPYRLKINWIGDRPIPLTGKGWSPAGVSPVGASPGRFFGSYNSSLRTYPIQCRPGRVSQTITIDLPEDVSLKSVPHPISEHTTLYSYVKEWTYSGQTLVIRTELSSRTPHRVCSPEDIQAIVAEEDNNPYESDPMLHFERREEGLTRAKNSGPSAQEGKKGWKKLG